MNLIEGYWFYERQAAGLGEHFRDSLMEDIDSLAVLAGAHAIVHGKHRKVASTFPYSIFYVVEDDEVRVHAVIDNRRDPAWVSERLN